MNIYRILDSNLNRLSEGLRVIEDYCRFIEEQTDITEELKSIRITANKIFSSPEDYQKLLKQRDSSHDIGKQQSFDKDNISRKSLADILRANLKRVQEAARVIEEYSKLINKNSEIFKTIRFQMYELEKKILSNLNNKEI